MQIEDDELSGHGEQRDEQDDLRLDDALLARDDVLQRVVELERDQERQHLAEHSLKRFLVERVEHSEHEPGGDADDQAIERDQDDQADEHREDQRDRALEALIVREENPLSSQALPSFGRNHRTLQVRGVGAVALGRRDGFGRWCQRDAIAAGIFRLVEGAIAALHPLLSVLGGVDFGDADAHGDAMVCP